MNADQRLISLEADLARLDHLLKSDPDGIELRFHRAVILREIGQTENAKRAYLELLALEPTHFGALNNLGTLAVETGFQTAGRTAYAEAVKHHPENPVGHVNLATALERNHEVEAALRHFTLAIDLDPDHPEAHQGLSRLLAEIGDEEAATKHRIKGFKNRPIKILPYRGTGKPIELLVLASAAGGAVPIWHHLDDRLFLTTVLYVDYYDPSQPLPSHQLVFNAVGDADLAKQSLETAAELLTQTTAPVINPPRAVMATGRAANAGRFANMMGVVTPKMAVHSRQVLERSDAPSLLLSQGFSFPLLLRSPGYHNGQFFTRVENEHDLSFVAKNMPGQELMVIQYLDARSADGKIRKYRVMMIDDQLFPLHVAISHDWKIHFVTAEMADNADNRAEDAAFLENMPQVLGARAMNGLEKIRESLGLDYAGADFSLSRDGEILLFEVNATMVVNPPDADARWNYRRHSVQRILDAIRRLLTRF